MWARKGKRKKDNKIYHDRPKLMPFDEYKIIFIPKFNLLKFSVLELELVKSFI